MEISVPAGLPPGDLQAKALSALLSRLDISNADIGLLKVILSLTARQVLRHGSMPDIRPLQALQSAIQSLQDASDMPKLLLDIVISYPIHLTALSPIIDSILLSHPTVIETIRTEILPELVTRLRLSDSSSDLGMATRIILSLVRSHEELLGVLLSEADYVLPAMRDAYPKLGRDKPGLGAKSDMLMVCHTLIQVMGASGGGAAMKRLMSESAGSSKRPLVDGTLRSDYEAIFERMSGLQEEELDTLSFMQNDQAKSDPVSASISL